jgi:hypothetical protein
MATRLRLTTLALFLALALAHTWPLASAPSRLSRNDNADTELNEWILAWDVHQALHDPRHLFDANIFYPDTDTLAYSEPLLVPAAIGAPLFWAGAAPVLVYNVLAIAGFTLMGWTGCLLVARWTDDWVAGIVSGVIIAFNAHTLTRLPHLQALHLEFLPLALLSLDAVLVERVSTVRAMRHAALLALWVVLQGWTSYYALLLTLVALVVGWAVRVDVWLPRARSVLPLLLAATVVALVALLPVLLPYRALGQARSLDEVAKYSAVWRDYLTTPARVHYDTWARPWFGSTGLFPGVTALALSLVALASKTTRRNGRARMAIAFGVAGVALSFGPALPAYAALYQCRALRLSGDRLARHPRGFRHRARAHPLATRQMATRRHGRGRARGQPRRLVRADRLCAGRSDLADQRATGRDERRCGVLPVLHRRSRVSQRAVPDRIDGALAADAQRLQRIHPAQLWRARPRAGTLSTGGRDRGASPGWRDARVRS